jgi:DNA uptake protein ComE-like DNA-binding protein
MNRPLNKDHDRRSLRQASILMLVLVAIIIMSLATGTYLALMRNEHVATRQGGYQQQVRLLTESAIEYLRVFISQEDEIISSQGGLHNNPGKLQNILVADDAIADFRGRFSVVASDVVQGYYSGFRFGLENESAKLNLNALDTSSSGGGGEQDENQDDPEDQARQRLMALPGMTEQIADAILDWLDEDEEPREFGAEAAYYLELSSPYRPRNGQLTSLDELLLVRGVTPELLYGLDTNRNYYVDTGEQPRGALQVVDNFSGQMNRGWSAYFTLYSIEHLTTPDGDRKIDVNSDNLQQLYNDLAVVLDEPSAKFIIAYRQFSPVDDSSDEGGGSSNEQGNSNNEGGASAGARTVGAESLNLDFEKEAANQIDSLFDLVGAKLSVEAGENEPATIVESPWRDEPATFRQPFLDLLDHASAERSRRIAGRVNINLASRPVLLSVPGMTDSYADQIISRRNAEVDLISGEQRHAVWILADGIVTQDEMRTIDPYVTTIGSVFSCQIVGYMEAIAAQARVEVVLDSTGRRTRLSAWHDLGPLGPGFSRTQLGVDLMVSP